MQFRRNYKKILFSLIYISVSIIIFSTRFAFSQTEDFLNFGYKNGLPGKTIYCIYLDSKGFIWVGTDAGVARFDGVTFEVFNAEDGISDFDVIKIFEDSKNRIWFFTLNGKADIFYNGKIYNHNNSEMLTKLQANSTCNSFLEDANNNIYFGTYLGEIFKLSDQDVPEKIYLETFSESISKGRVCLAFNKDNEVVGTNGVGLINLSNNKLEEIWDSVYYIAYATEVTGTIVYFKNKKFYKYKNGINTELYFYDKEVSEISRVYLDRNDHLYVTEMSLRTIVFRDATNKSQYDVFTMPASVSHVFNDKRGNKWIGSIYDGIYLYTKKQLPFLTLNKKNGLHDNIVISLFPFDDEKLLIGLSKGGYHVMEKRFSLSKQNQLYFTASNRAIKFHKDRNGEIWIATDVGLHKFKYHKPYDYTTEVLYNNKGYAILKNGALKDVVSNSKGEVFIGDDSGIGFKAKAERTEIKIFSPIERQRIFSIFFDSKDALWFSCNNGVEKFSKGHLFKYSDKYKVLSGRMKCFGELPDSTVVVGSLKSGLLFLKNDELVRSITMDDGLPSNTINCLSVVDSIIYIGTDKGLSKVSISGNGSYSISNMNSLAGLSSNDVTCLAVTDSFIYVGTSMGVDVFKFPLNVYKSDLPATYLKAFIVDDKIFDFEESVIIPYNYRNINISFSCPEYVNPDQVRYRYRISSREEWTQSRISSVNFFGLSNGIYRFEIQSMRGDTDWGHSAFVKFEILPPFWKTWWFITISILFVLLLTFFAVNYIIRRKLRKKIAVYKEQQALEMERKRISADMHDDLGADLTDIVIMSRIARDNKTTTTPQSLANIEQAANDVITKMNEIVWALNPSNDTMDNLTAYLRVYANNYCEFHGLKLNFEAPVIKDIIILKSSIRRNIFLCIKECLHNIVKHANAQNVKIHITVEEAKRSFSIVIEDNGNGMKERRPNDRIGNGYLNMNKRMQEINGEIIMEFNNKGTKIELLIIY